MLPSFAAGAGLSQVQVAEAHVAERNRTEQNGGRYNPCPLHSATIDDCLLRRRDMMAGGARYSSGSISLTGVASLVDSLLAMRAAVYEERLVSLPELRTGLAGTRGRATSSVEPRDGPASARNGGSLGEVALPHGRRSVRPPGRDVPRYFRSLPGTAARPGPLRHGP